MAPPGSRWPTRRGTRSACRFPDRDPRPPAPWQARTTVTSGEDRHHRAGGQSVTPSPVTGTALAAPSRRQSGPGGPQVLCGLMFRGVRLGVSVKGQDALVVASVVAAGVGDVGVSGAAECAGDEVAD